MCRLGLFSACFHNDGSSAIIVPAIVIAASSPNGQPHNGTVEEVLFPDRRKRQRPGLAARKSVYPRQ